MPLHRLGMSTSTSTDVNDVNGIPLHSYSHSHSHSHFEREHRGQDQEERDKANRDKNRFSAPGSKRRKDGCLTCRRRRVGCGRERPACAHCTRLCLTCRWPPEIDLENPDRPNTDININTNTNHSNYPTTTTTSTSTSDTLPFPHPHSHSLKYDTSSNSTRHSQDSQNSVSVPVTHRGFADPTRNDVWNLVIPPDHDIPHSQNQNKYGHTSLTGSSIPIQPSYPHPHPHQYISGSHADPPPPPPAAPPPPPHLQEQQHHLYNNQPLDAYSWNASFDQAHTQSVDFPLETFSLPFDFYSGIVGPELSFDINTSTFDGITTSIPGYENAGSAIYLPPPPHIPPPPSASQISIPISTLSSYVPASTQPPPPTSASAPSPRMSTEFQAPKRMPVILEMQDQPIVSHYLENISDFAKVRDTAVPNHYLSLFSAGLFYPPLYAGILAFSSRHLAWQLAPDSERRKELVAYSAEKHAVCGRALYQGLSDVANLDVDVLLPAILIYCQYEISMGSGPSRIQGLLDLTKLLIQRLPDAVPRLQPFTQRVAVILTSYDVRASMFGLGSAAYTRQLGEPLFRDDTGDSEDFRSWGVSADLLYINYLTTCCILIDRDLREARTLSSTEQVLDGMSKGQILYRRIIKLQKIFDPPLLDKLSAPPSTYSTTKTKAKSTATATATSLGGAGGGNNNTQDRKSTSTSTSKSNEVLEVSAEAISKAFIAGLYNSLIIYLCRVLQIPVPTRPVDRIINSALNLYYTLPTGPHSIFPRPLFFAALEIDDASQFDWVLGRLAHTAAAGWGHDVERKRELLIEIRRAEAGGVKQDLGQLMLISGPPFIL